MSELKITQNSLENAILKDGQFVSGYVSEVGSIIIDASGYGAHAEGYVYSSEIGAYSLGAFATGCALSGNIIASGNGAHAEGCAINNSNIIASGNGAHAEGINTQALADGAHAEGYNTSALGYASHAGGNSTTASGMASHAEGIGTIASGAASHAEGIYSSEIKSEISWEADAEPNQDDRITFTQNISQYYKFTVGEIIQIKPNNTYYIITDVVDNNKTILRVTPKPPRLSSSAKTDFIMYKQVSGIAQGDYSHASGGGVALGNYSHAEGCFTVAEGNYSHASGLGTVANREAMTAIGTYNNLGVTNELFAVGYGQNNPYSKEVERNTVFNIVGNTQPGSTGRCTVNLKGDISINGNINVTSGEVHATGGFYDESDIRKKDILSNISLEKSYELLDKCQEIIYTLKEDPNKKEQVGMIAQEVEEFFPEIVSTDNNGFKSLDYARLSVICLRLIKDIVEQIKELKNEIKNLKN